MAKKKPEVITELVSDTFTILYAALMILLLAFFILLNSMASLDDDAIKEVLGSLLGSFGLLPGGLQVFSGDFFIPPGAPMLMDVEESLPITRKIRHVMKRFSTGGRFNEDTEDTEIHLGDEVTISMSGGDLVLTLSERVLFEANSATLSGPYTQTLEGIGDEFRLMENPIEVEGHTDDRPVRGGRYASNRELSAARAISVLRFFSERCGIPNWRLAAVAHGEHRPMVPNETPEMRAKNRRVSLVIKGREEQSEPIAVTGPGRARKAQ